jgi:tetratricopeptide (TPR) repeat protein
MMGVGLLKEVLQQDPDNRKALNYIGLFSMQSAQYDKAIERFEHLVKLGPDNDPDYPFYYRSLGQAYAAAGKKNEALGAYKKYKSLVKDENLKQEADKLINTVQ